MVFRAYMVLCGGYRFLTGEMVPLRLGLLKRPVSDVDPDSLTPNDFS